MPFRSSVLLLMLLASGSAALATDPADKQDEFFEKQIRPLLVEHCLECHSDKKPQGGLRLTSRELFLKGGESGSIVVPGKPAESVIIRAVAYLDEPKMPPKGKLLEKDIATLRQWVQMGAAWPASASLVSRAEGAEGQGGFRISPRQQAWWSFQPIRRTVPSAAVNHDWSNNEVDQFIAAKLHDLKIGPSASADRRTWLRRVTYDLTGLPPTPEDIDEFLADVSEDAFERVVDRLLASPAHGQHWARHWLDVVRYADYHDGDAKARDTICEPLQAWRYRDWVVNSFNRDLPFDQFIIHQIAGDVLPAPDGLDYYADGLVATTFLTNGSWDRGDADKEKMVSDMVDDNIDTIGKAFLGLTLGCARCHDHKFDPVSQSDYYGLAGIFYSTRILKELGTKGGNYTLQRIPLAPRDYVAKRGEQLRVLNELNSRLTELDKKDPKPADDDPERVSLVAERDRLKGELLPEPPLAEAVSEGGTPGGLFPGIQDVPIHIRGSYTRLGPVVPRHMPEFFAAKNQPVIAGGSGRRELADWIVSNRNPLTARVIANRVWQWHFGDGLVRTPNNFGLTSQPPTHSELLDWLATRVIETGWSLKPLHRQILVSSTYRQSSASLPDQYERDPDNLWLGRFRSRRLEAESIRDAMLFVSDTLDLTPAGPARADLSIPQRSLYVQTARWDRGTFATLFDSANPDDSVETRTISTVAPQALFLLNASFPQQQARLLAERILREIPDDVTNADDLRIDRLYRLLFGRVASDEERKICRQVVEKHNSTGGVAGWFDLAHILLCSNEFIYVD